MKSELPLRRGIPFRHSVDTSLGSGSARLTDRDIARVHFAGISVPMHTALCLGVRVAERLRAINSHCHLCLFGLYAELNADALHRSRLADSLIGAEPTAALAELLGVPGDPSPLPRRDTMPGLERYVRLHWREHERLTGAVETTRSCKYHCPHCPIPPIYDGRLIVVPRARDRETIPQPPNSSSTRSQCSAQIRGHSSRNHGV